MYFLIYIAPPSVAVSSRAISVRTPREEKVKRREKMQEETQKEWLNVEKGGNSKRRAQWWQRIVWAIVVLTRRTKSEKRSKKASERGAKIVISEKFWSNTRFGLKP